MFETDSFRRAWWKALPVSLLIHCAAASLLFSVSGSASGPARIVNSLNGREQSEKVKIEFRRPSPFSAPRKIPTSQVSQEAPSDRKEQRTAAEPHSRRLKRTAAAESRRQVQPAPTPEQPAAENLALAGPLQDSLGQLHDTLGRAFQSAPDSVQPGRVQLDERALSRPEPAVILSDNKGVDFASWLRQWQQQTDTAWRNVIPYQFVTQKTGTVVIRFKVLPNGRVMDGSVVVENRSGDAALDRAASGALLASAYPPLPRDFHGNYLELRAFFMFNAMKLQ